ncbi:DUF4097 family beta strand repeat-containing protein [Xanthocytophaga flava]|uniref:DUF4097 family beta strand repeat-containing protein n=1 Tax=Xanthocytophaga flava TaxID=3048013 RepID=UPI0028D0A59B|nr:DUF4097 family beta strand repeat-containing protein [Xanthocytophaga flavus]MDJ1467164.1 hypothetical protein [Xanthocytophaga flavus]
MKSFSILTCIACLSVWHLQAQATLKKDQVPTGRSTTTRSITAGNSLSGSSLSAVSSDVDTTIHTLNLQERFVLQPLQLDIHLPAQVSIERSTGSQIEVKVKGKGKSYQAQIQSASEANTGKRLLVDLQDKQQSISSTADLVQIQIFLPANASVKGWMRQGELKIEKVQAELSLDLGNGTISLQDSEGSISLSSQAGSVVCTNSHFNGNLSALSGSVALQQCRGQISGDAAVGSFSVDSPTQPVNAQLGSGQLQLQVAEGDVMGSVYEGTLNFAWKGDKQVKGQYFSFSAQKGRLNLGFPVGFPLDIQLDQTASETQTETQMATVTTTSDPAVRQIVSPTEPLAQKVHSDFSLRSFGKEKQLTHNGQKLRLVQGEQQLHGGGNRLSLYAADSEVYLQKAK